VLARVMIIEVTKYEQNKNKNKKKEKKGMTEDGRKKNKNEKKYVCV